jgi:hypothetical protein
MTVGSPLRVGPVMPVMNVHVVLGGHQPNHHWEAHPAVISSYTLLKDAENWSESGKQRTAAR